MVEILLKLIGIICATVVAYVLATTKDGRLQETHPFAALFLELIALSIIFSN